MHQSHGATIYRFLLKLVLPMDHAIAPLSVFDAEVMLTLAVVSGRIGFWSDDDAPFVVCKSPFWRPPVDPAATPERKRLVFRRLSRMVSSMGLLQRHGVLYLELTNDGVPFVQGSV